MIGRYEIVEPIGEGGYGVVFMAEQTSPVQRKVAIKIIKAGMDTRQVIARFEAERQALALMDHPNIARVFDAGTTETGRPYFVMELVKGVPITKYCDEHHLTPRQRLELFMQVCLAVQHAHQKGIIHRDLKPSNVLIALYDGKPVPKVIDFGVAKATGQNLTEHTMFTGFGDVIGTLEYMSPEQAQVNQLDVDTRSDIYSLGVLLYELLTGTTPLEHQRVMKSGLLEMLRVVREEEPPKPSMRLSTTEQLASISACRGLEPKRLSGLVKGELDWIVMKALEKDRGRRYETANGLAMDVQRYLADEAVHACPPSARYRFRKFARRHKAALISAAGLMLVVVLGIGGLIISNRTVTREKRQKEIALRDALQERARADANLARARKAVNEFLTVTAGNPRLLNSDLHDLRRGLLQSALPFYEEFVRQQEHDPELEAERGRAFGDLALIREELNELDRALLALDQRLSIFQRLTQQYPKNLSYRRELANSSRNIGNVLAAAGELDRAEAAYSDAIDMLEALCAEDPTAGAHRRDLADAYSNLGILKRGRGRMTEALEVQQKALALRERLDPDDGASEQNRADLAANLINLSSVLSNLKRYEEALAAVRRAADLSKDLAQHQPRSVRLREMWGTSLDNQSEILCALDRRDEALVVAQQAIEINEKLAQDLPSVARYRQGLAMSLYNLAMLMSELGRKEEALAASERAVTMFEILADEFPNVPHYREQLAESRANHGDLSRRFGRRDPPATASATSSPN